MTKKNYKFFLLPGNAYAFDFPVKIYSLSEAKQWVRNFLKVNKLPNGTQIW